MIDGQTQLAVLQVNSGDWEVRTSDRSAGTIRNLSWNGDGSRIFFDRVRGDGDRVFSVPAVGGSERSVLEDAKIADTLPDGSLLVNRSIAGRYQLHRFWPDTARLESLPAFPREGLFAPVRALPNGSQAIFYGYGERPGSAAAPAERLYRIDLITKQLSAVVTDLELRTAGTEYTANLNGFPLAVFPDGKTLLLDLPSGDLHRIAAVSLDGDSSVRTLVTVTAPPLFIDAARDGSVYVDQVNLSLEVARTTVNGASIQRFVKSTVPPQYCSSVLPLPDGTVLFPAQLSGRARLLVASAGKEPKSFADTTEESAPPMALAGGNQIAFMLGRPPNPVIALASAADGRLIRRIELPGGAEISCMASSPDGKMIYYISNRFLWVVPSTGSEPRRLVGADAVALHPKTGEIVIQRNETNGVHFFRFDAVNGREQQIEIRDAEAPPSGGPLSSRSIAPDGRIVFPIWLPDRSDWEIGLLDPLHRSLKRVPMDYAGGLNSPAWTSDGYIVFAGAPFSSSIWRFQPVGGTPQNP